MDIKSLKRYVEESGVHARLLGAYDGPYALGIGTSPDDPHELVLVLRVAGFPPAGQFPRSIELGRERERVRVDLRPGYVEPVFHAL
jgi:hypothetical protein